MGKILYVNNTYFTKMMLNIYIYIYFFFLIIKQIHTFAFLFKPTKIFPFHSILKKKKNLGLTLVGQDFYLVGQGSLYLNKSGQCSKSIFSYTVRGFDPIPRLRARPKCEFQNSTEILCSFLCYFLKTPEFGRSPEFREPATALPKANFK